jgi:catechol 2,3-dioxygenase-like lactoylglutathione lyase family enzyme
MFTPLGLDHVVFRVADLAAAQRFYVEVLGCTVDHVNERLSLVHLRFGEHYIDLLPATAQAPAAPAGGVDHVCLSIRCEDLGKVADALRRRGVTLQGELAQRRGAYGTGPSLYVRDPDGHVIELKPRPA